MSQDQATATTTTTTETVETPQATMMADIADMLGLDTTEPPTATPSQSQSSAPQQSTQTAPNTQEKPEEPSASAAAGATETPGNKAPETETKPEKEPSLKEVLKEVLAETKAAPAETKPEEPKKTDAPNVQYRPDVPDAIMSALESDDPVTRKQGMNALMAGAMNKVYNDLSALMRTEIAAAMQQVPIITKTAQTEEQTKKELHDTFYAENPAFGSNPEFKSFVAFTALQMAQKLGKDFKGNTPEFRNALAAEVERITGVKAGKTPVAAPPPTPAPKPKTFTTGGSPTRGEVKPNLGTEILDVVTSF